MWAIAATKPMVLATAQTPQIRKSKKGFIFIYYL
jgi:hypothetical protein